MHAQHSEDPSVQERLDRLELTSRRLQTWAGVLALATVMLTGEALRQASGRLKLVSAEQFEVRGKDGVLRGHFGLRPDGLPELALYDEKGELKVALHMYCDRGAALVFNDRGDTPIHLESPGDGSAAIRLQDTSGQTTSTMFMTSDGSSGLSFDHGRESVLMGVKPDTHTGLVVTDAEGREQGRVGSRDLNAKSMGIRAISPQDEVGVTPVSVSAEIVNQNQVDDVSPPPTWGLTKSNERAVVVPGHSHVEAKAG